MQYEYGIPASYISSPDLSLDLYRVLLLTIRSILLHGFSDVN